MTEKLKHIKSGQGLGNLLFGMLRAEVEKLIGPPDEKEINSHSLDIYDNHESWHYDELELSISFSEEENWRLDTISINSPYYLLYDTSLHGKSVLEIRNQLEEWKVKDIEFEDLGESNQKLLSSEKLGMNFWFDNESLSEIQWGPLLLDNETIAWPV